VLNCFAYTGGFSLYAMRGGAAEVVSVDSGNGLAEAVADNLALNRLSNERHRFVTEDCFTLLDTCSRSGRCFDLVVLDPPSFARSRSSAYAARRAYVRLNMLAMRCLEPGGSLVSASCTSQISPDQFRELLADAAQRADRRLTIMHEAGQAIDHPVPAAFPEGRYLKFVIGRVADVR
jgi:23S rRNA (cytosine1962-C5)-methyltransferase